ncbi:MAG: hypothetical protein QM654_01020 [Dysgonamonadaceae bacterium]
MTLYIIVAACLILFTLFLINSKLFNNFRKTNGRTFEFFISIISTFTGFFIAVSLNTVLAESAQKQNLIKVLNAANLSIENSESKTKGMYINPATSGANLNEIIQYAPVELPKMFANMESNTLVSDYFSSNAFQAYIMCSDNMGTFVKDLNATNVPIERKKAILNTYLKFLDLAKQVNTLEIQRLNGDISTGDENKALAKLNQEISTKK